MTKSTITREPITHDLKIYPEFFSSVCTGVKRAELRKNDRDYRVGDTLHLMETPRGSCHQTGEFINVKITHIADVGEWMPGFVMLSIELQERRKADSEPVEWLNGCNKTIPAALRYLAENPRPIGGESSFNTAHLYQLAREIELMAEGKLYRHAQPTVSKPWGYTSGILNPAVGMACVTPTRGKNQFPVYLEPQPAPVVPDFKTLALELVGNLVDCGGLDEGVKERYLEWAEKTCRAAMLNGGES